MAWWLVLLGIVYAPIVAWGMWLVFCYAVGRTHGVEGLKTALGAAKSFPVAAWVGILKAAAPLIRQLPAPDSTPPHPDPPA